MDGKDAADALLAAIAAQVAEIGDPLEGVRDGQRMAHPDGTEEDMKAVDADEDRFLQARLDLMAATKAAVDALLAHGFPALPIREVDAVTYEKLAAQVRTQQAALARFAPKPPAAHATITGLDAGVARPDAPPTS